MGKMDRKDVGTDRDQPFVENILCQECIEECKQSDRVVIQWCPCYKSKVRDKA